MPKEWIIKKPDGTVKQLNPFTGAEVWTVTGRGYKPVQNQIPNTSDIGNPTDESHCDFCESKYRNTPPEKSRLVSTGDSYRIEKYLPLEKIREEKADFRRIGNLFEIVSYDYWHQNYTFTATPEINSWKENYLKSAGGLDHVLSILDYKLKLRGLPAEEREKISLEEKLDLANAFFAGGHELIISRKHFNRNSASGITLCSSGELTPQEHYHYIKFTIETMKEIYAHNKYIRYISIFQNWLKSAGASFDHLHKQLVAIDEWGTSIEHELKLLRQNPNIYNLFAANYAGYKNLIIAENDYAIAFADFGHRFPTLAVYSKTEETGPIYMNDEEIRGMSDLIHACHAAMSSHIPCNEEWYYSPLDAIEVIPWHILIKWRINTPAGFEGGTKIYINTIDPESLRDRVVPELRKLRTDGKIAPMKISEECSGLRNPLKYYKRYLRA